MKVSVICATLGPLSEVDSLIQSIVGAMQRTESGIFVEFILVDQSDDSLNLSSPISDKLHLIHIHNTTRGLSLNRNIGLVCASGEWVMFLDSDCVVSIDYFEIFFNLRQAYPDVSHFIGKILDPNSKLPLFRNWPRRSRRLSKGVMWYYATSINSIFKVGDTKSYFDERFGLGARYGSCEDIDFFLNFESSRLYCPNLTVFHPDIFQEELPREKLNSYSFGFGALCAKHAFPLGILMLMVSLIKKALDVLLGRATPMDFAFAAVFRSKGFFGYCSDRARGRRA
jgi:glycosyltransferase involved in cell wall biosynthesis